MGAGRQPLVIRGTSGQVSRFLASLAVRSDWAAPGFSAAPACARFPGRVVPGNGHPGQAVMQERPLPAEPPAPGEQCRGCSLSGGSYVAGDALRDRWVSDDRGCLGPGDDSAGTSRHAWMVTYVTGRTSG